MQLQEGFNQVKTDKSNMSSDTTFMASHLGSF